MEYLSNTLNILTEYPYLSIAIFLLVIATATTLIRRGFRSEATALERIFREQAIELHVSDSSGHEATVICLHGSEASVLQQKIRIKKLEHGLTFAPDDGLTVRFIVPVRASHPFWPVNRHRGVWPGYRGAIQLHLVEEFGNGQPDSWAIPVSSSRIFIDPDFTAAIRRILARGSRQPGQPASEHRHGLIHHNCSLLF